MLVWLFYRDFGINKTKTKTKTSEIEDQMFQQIQYSTVPKDSI